MGSKQLIKLETQEIEVVRAFVGPFCYFYGISHIFWQMWIVYEKILFLFCVERAVLGWFSGLELEFVQVAYKKENKGT